MKELVKTIKLHIYPDNNAIALFKDMTMKYRDACNFISAFLITTMILILYMFRMSYITTSVTTMG